MSFFSRTIRYHSSIQAFWQAQHKLGHRYIATAADAESVCLAGQPLTRGGAFSSQTLFYLPTLSFKLSARVATTTSSSLISVGGMLVDSLQSLLGDISTWFIKRTYQPSIIRKRRKHGFRRRKESVGGRRVLKRRMAKGRIRLGGC